ncbi:MAG: ThiF family adenylyltransferase [Bryobacteraceae bacterium]|nr:ThiF family adenylyltransferase [Bryobacteraceae bacterium]
MVAVSFSAADRYSRQIRFHGIGEEGQVRISRARVAIVGCGALGSMHAAALARAGVGLLRLIDRDYVEASNLQRQWLFEEADAEQAIPKAVAAARRLRAANSSIECQPAVADLTPENAAELLSGMDLILDGSDNFEVRYLLNDYSVENGVPWIYGAAVGSYGLAMPVIPGRTACLACIYPDPPQGAQPTCETAGVLNAVTGMIGALQAGLALRCLVTGEVPARITTVDVWSGEMRQVDLPAPDPACRACGRRQLIHLHGRKRAPVSLCGRNAVQIHEQHRRVELRELGDRLAAVARVRVNEFALRAELDGYELTVFPDGRAIIKGTTDIAVARGIYARYVG